MRAVSEAPYRLQNENQSKGFYIAITLFPYTGGIRICVSRTISREERG